MTEIQLSVPVDAEGKVQLISVADLASIIQAMSPQSDGSES